MTESLIDIFQIDFWLTVGVAVLLLAPLAQAQSRRLAFLGVNVFFLWTMLSYYAGVALLGVALVWLLLKLVGSGPVRWFWHLGFIATVLALFVFHKLPNPDGPSHVVIARNILATIGFSYVTLRLFEVVRAVAERRTAPPGLADTLNYLLPFHMLASGPIQAYEDYVAQPPVPPPLAVRGALEATERIIRGMSKKYVLGHILNSLFLTGFRTEGWYLVLEIQVFFLWLYLDFSAYSDIAVGIGRLMGVATPENFNRPYLARNLMDFWNRWHISLSLFIQRNVFIPIQLTLMRYTGGRRQVAVGSIAFAVSFLIVGLWHELSMRFLLFGAMQAAGLVACNVYKHWLTARFGARGVQSYLQTRSITFIAISVTFEYQAFSLYLAFRSSGGV